MSTDTTPEAPVDTSTDTERPQTLADALGENGPGIADEIESELADGGTVVAGDVGGVDTSIPKVETDPSIAERLGLLSDLQVMVTARLCETKQPLGEILSMSPGDVLDLGRTTGAPIELLANGVLVAYGEVVAVGNSLGVRVTKLAS
jgi:flagellar motor switch protein FliN